MRKGLFGLSIALLTFVAGLSTVSITSWLSISYPSHNPAVEVTYDRPITPAIKKHEFLPTYRAIATGIHIQSYVTDDGQELREGSASVIGYRTRYLAAKRIIDRVIINHRERVVIENRGGPDGKPSFSVLSYAGGDYYRFIDAPSVDVAQELEWHLLESDLLLTGKFTVLR
jgi:transglutaminase-like putative cysteine protease